MSSCTFIQIKNYRNETIVLNPDKIKMFMSVEDKLTKVYFIDNNDVTVAIPFENFKTLLKESNYFIKSID